MRYQVKRPAGQRLYFVVDTLTAAVKARLRTKASAVSTCLNWNGTEQERLRELFALRGLQLVSA